MTAPTRMQIESFFDPATSTFSHLLWDSATQQCAIIDSVLDYDPKSGRTATASADRVIERVRALGLHVQWLLETHVHADHLSAAPYLQRQVGGQLAIGSHITTVQNVFGKLFNAGTEFARDGSQFDRLLAEGDRFQFDLPDEVELEAEADVFMISTMTIEARQMPSGRRRPYRAAAPTGARTPA